MTNIEQLAQDVMRGVVNSGCLNGGIPADITMARDVMREEIKALLFADMDTAGKYTNERAIALTGGHGLAMASLVTECALRITAARRAKLSPEG